MTVSQKPGPVGDKGEKGHDGPQGLQGPEGEKVKIVAAQLQAFGP